LASPAISSSERLPPFLVADAQRHWFRSQRGYRDCKAHGYAEQRRAEIAKARTAAGFKFDCIHVLIFLISSAALLDAISDTYEQPHRSQ
jgi:hypothetical protein